MRSAATRARLLAAARRLFSQRGYDGVSVDRVVEAAGVNKRMVYHYFGSKRGMYAEVLRGVYEALARVEAHVFEDEPGPELAVERLLRSYFRFLQEHPDLLAILLWENLQGGRHLDAVEEGLSKQPILEALGETIDRGIAGGSIRPDIDRRHLLINLIGLCLVYHSNRHTLSRSVGLDLDNPAVMEQGIRHAIALARHGFLNGGRGHG